MAALKYRDVKSLYDELKEAGVTTATMPEWASRMNAATKSDTFSAGVNDDIVKRFSNALDVGLEHFASSKDDAVMRALGTPEEGYNLPVGAGDVVAGLLKTAGVGPEFTEQAREYSKGLPRMATNMLPMLIPGIGGLLGMAGLSGSEAYTESDSVSAGLIAGGSAMIMPKVAQIGEQALLKRAGGKLLEGPLANAEGKVTKSFSRYFPTSRLQGAASQTAGQVAASGFGQAERMVEAGLTPDDPENPRSTYNFSPTEMLLEMTLGQLPFVATYLTKHGRAGLGGQTTQHLVRNLEADLAQSQRNIDLRVAREALAKKSPIEKIPTVTQPTAIEPQVLKEQQSLLAQLRGQQIKVKNDANMTPEERVEATNDLLRRESVLLRERELVPVSPQSIFGDSIAEDSPREQIVGRTLRETPGARAIYVEDFPVNPENLRGKVVWYSKAYEPNPTQRSDGTTVFGLPDVQWRTVRTREEWQSRFPKRGDETMELKVQPTEATREQMFAHIADLQRVENDVGQATTTGDLHEAVTRLNSVQDEAGLLTTDDVSLRKTAKQLENLVDPTQVAKAAVAVEAKKTARKITTRETERAVAPLSEEQAAEVSAMMEGGGFQIKTLDKLSHTKEATEVPGIEGQPHRDLVAETAIRVSLSDDGGKAFNSWNRKAETSLLAEQQRFVQLTDELGTLTPDKVAHLPVEAKDEFEDFIKRPHVQVWTTQLENEVARMRAGNAAPTPARPQLPAGQGWLFSMGEYDPTTNVLNQKHKLPKDGTLREASFRNMAGVGKPLTEAEMQLYRAIVPEAFDGQGNVKVPILWKGLKEKGPVVEVRKLGVQTEGNIAQEQGRLVHELDTAWPNWREARDAAVEQEWIEKAPNENALRIARELLTNVGQQVIDHSSSYSSIAPKPESEMPGYVEGLVRVPQTGIATEKEIKSLSTVGYDKVLGVKYRGPHFGSEDTNVLAFFRGYEENLPDGTKAFHVIEVQSDWGQRVRDLRKQNLGLGGQKDVDKMDHPLLRVYESLALKAAIQHAKEVGATKVILSDAETAMMTEGQDRISGTQGMTREQFRQMDMEGVTPEESDRLWEAAKLKEPPQAKGMRLHYDQTLPSAMEKLTGVKGERVDLGQHKTTKLFTGPDQMERVPVTDEFLDALNERDARGELQPGEYDQLIQEEHARTKGSPVFRDTSGNPKTQITGRVYDISNTPDAFTLTDKARSPEKPYVLEPEDAPRIAELGIDQGGEGMRQFLLKTKTYSWLAKDLEKYPELLTRITGRLQEQEVGARANNKGGGRVELTFSPAILEASPEIAGHHIAHELVHGLTLTELDNPTKVHIVKEFTNIRQKLIESLPKADRAAYDKAVADDWYNKYANGEVEFSTLYPENTLRALVLYGLLTDQELVAQGLSEPQMRVFMQGIKSEGKSWFHRFTNVVKNLIGLGDHIPDTLFEEFLSRTDALMQHGEHVSSFLNYSNRYFENLGYSQGLVNAQSRRAMALVMDSANGTTPEAMFAMLQQSPLIRSTELIRTNREVTKMLQEKGEDFQIFSSVMDELGHNVDMRGLNDFAYEALVRGENHDAIDLLPDSASKYLFAQAKDMADVIGVLKAASSEKNQGLINLTDAKGLRLPVAEATKMLDKILSVSKMHDLAVEQIQALYAMEPDGYLDKLVADPVRAPEWVDDADKTKRKTSWLKNFLQPMAQAAREDSRMGELVTKGFQLNTNIRKMASEGLKMFGIDPDQLGKGNVLSKLAVDRTEKIFRNPKLVRAVNEWMFHNQWMGQKTGSTTIRPATDPEIAKVLNGLNQNERTQVQEVIAKHQISMQMMHAQQLEKMLQISASDASVLIGSDTGLKTPQNIQLAETLLKAAVVDRNNPLEVSAFIKEHGTDIDTQVALVQQRLEPEVFNRLLKYSLNEAEKYNAWKEFFAANPAWSSGQRYGKYLVEYKRGNRTFLAGVESSKEAEALAEGGKITKFESNRKYDDDSPPNLGPDAVSMITRLRELEQNRINMLKDKMTPDQIEDLQKFSPVEQLATEEAYRGGVPNLRPPARGLRKGAEELPWLSNHFSWVQKTSSFWSRQLLRAQARAHLLDPEIAQDRELQTRLKTHIDNMLSNDPELAAKASRFTTTWFMGYNPASALINGTQSFVTHVAEFTSLTGKPLESYRRVTDAMGELRDAKIGRKGFRGEDHERLMTDAAKDGEIDYSLFDTDAAAQESIITNYKRVLNGQRIQTLGQRLGTAAGVYTTAGMWMFRGVEKFNNQIALIASFDYYQEQGLNYTDAKARAYEFNRAVNYGGGRAQRPVGAFSGRDPVLRGAAVTMTALQNYTLGTTFQIARYLQRGFFRPEGTTPAERHNARIAATQMLATQLAAAGVLGLPFVSGAIALLDSMFPGLELNKNLRERMTQFFQSDKENGSTLADIAMTGVPSMFGWDLQSRLSMGNTVPGVSEVNGFQPELLAGPPANLVGNFVKEVGKFASGDLAGGVRSFLPSALKKSTQLLQSGGTVKDYRDRPIFEPSAGETLGIALGFQPKRLSDYNTAARIVEQSQTLASRRVGQERQALAEQVLKGEYGTVRQQLLAKAQDDKSYNPLEEVRAIARSAEELTFPRDLRREGSRSTAPEREKLLRSFNLPPNSVSEIDRVKFRWQIQQRLGLPSGSKAELQRAQVIDQLRQRNPNATRSELSRQADLLLRHSSRQLQELPE